MVHGEICIFLIHLFCSYIHIINMYYIRIMYMYVSSLLLSSENMGGTRPFK